MGQNGGMDAHPAGEAENEFLIPPLENDDFGPFEVRGCPLADWCLPGITLKITD